MRMKWIVTGDHRRPGCRTIHLRPYPQGAVDGLIQKSFEGGSEKYEWKILIPNVQKFSLVFGCEPLRFR